MNNANTHELIIPLSRKSEAEKLVKKLQRKADKLGQFAPVISWGEKKTLQVEVCEGVEIDVPCIELNLVSKVIGLNGWSVLASITHGAESNVVLCFGHDDDSATELAEQYRNAKPHCDHCGKVRSRKTTMIVRDVFEHGNLRQVGSSCLKEYTGIDPAYVLSVSSMIDMLRDFDEDQDVIGDRVSRDGLPVDAYLAWVIAAVEIEGGIFMTRNMADDYGSSTASLAYTIGRESCNASHYAAAREVAQWAKDIDDDSSSFELNMRAIAQNGFVEYKHDGIAAYIYEAFRKAQERAEKEAIEVATQVAESTHVGTVGTRETFKVTLDHVFRVDTQWGDSYGHKFVTDSGAVIMWWTSSRVDLDRGESATVKATVKEHTEYNGQLQTKVTRVKVA